MRAAVSGGILGRSSSATYELRLVCRDVEKLPDILGVVTSAKQVTLQTMSWQYDESDDASDRRLEAAATKARARATRVASALGVRLLGVHRFAEHRDSDMVGAVEFAEFGGATRGKGRHQPVDPGVEFRNERTVSTTVEVQFHVSRFEP